MLTLLALVIALVALGGVAALGAAARTRDQEFSDVRTRLARLEVGAELSVRDVVMHGDGIGLTLVNIGRGECLWATVVAAAHGAQSRPVEIGSLPPIRDGHPGTAVDIPIGPAAKGFEAFPVWLRVSYGDTLGERRVSLRLPGARGGEDASGARAAGVATAG